MPVHTAARTKSIRIGEGRGVAILASLRNAGGKMLQREFEEVCLSNCRTLVGAGGFIARGSIVRQEVSGDVEYVLTDKGEATIDRWEMRYGREWIETLESPGVLGDSQIHNHQKVGLLPVGLR